MRKKGWLRKKIDFNSKYTRTSSLRKKKWAVLCYTAGGQIIQLYFECFDFWQVGGISEKIKMATEKVFCKKNAENGLAHEKNRF